MSDNRSNACTTPCFCSKTTGCRKIIRRSRKKLQLNSTQTTGAGPQLNLRLIRRLAPARMAIRYIPARLELQLLSLPRLLAPTLAYGHYQVTGMQHVWLLVTRPHACPQRQNQDQIRKICCNLKKNLGSRRPPQGRRPGAVAPPRAMVDPPLYSTIQKFEEKKPNTTSTLRKRCISSQHLNINKCLTSLLLHVVD